MAIAILMPAFNEASRLARTLGQLRDHADDAGGITVFLVDDGSDPAIGWSALPAPSPAFRIVLARHAVNLGQGAALETARQLALGDEARFTAYVTMDADGQHAARDAVALANAIIEGADVAFGDRFSGGSDVPFVRRGLLRAARAFERVVTGLRLGDAHNGLRAFRREALDRIAIRQNRMAHATEIKMRVSRAGSLRIVEVPVSVRYTRESLAKGQRSSDAAGIVRDLLVDFLFGDP